MRLTHLHFFLLTLTVILVNGIDYYVSTTGNDQGDGDVTNPFASLSKAVRVAQDDDVILLFEGIYEGNS